MELSVEKQKVILDPLVGIAVAIDTETTGLDQKADRVISFGAVTLVDGKVTTSVEWFFNPGDVEIHPDALKIHGITKEFLADKPPIKAFLPQIMQIVASALVCGHNVKFDIDMLDAELRRHRYPTLAQYIAGIYDTMKASRERWPGKKATLDALCERAGVRTGHRALHGALKDAMLVADVLIAMGREQRSLLGEDGSGEPDDSTNAGPLLPMAPIIVVRASKDETAEHDAYLAGMASAGVAPIWASLAGAREDLGDVGDDEDEIAAAAHLGLAA